MYDHNNGTFVPFRYSFTVVPMALSRERNGTLGG